jgi:hypothetical protein
MNKHTQHTSRKNKGTLLLPQLDTVNPYMPVSRHIKTKHKRIYKRRFHSTKSTTHTKTIRKRKRKRIRNMTRKRKTKPIKNDSIN